MTSTLTHRTAEMNRIELEADVPARLLMADAQLFHERFNRHSFAFSHSLAAHPLFEIPRLVELSTHLPKPDVFFAGAEVAVNQRFGQMPRKPLSLQETIARIEEAGSWVVLKRIERDPAYRVLLDRLMAEIEELSGMPLEREIVRKEGFIFITSPGCVTPYHIDPECNFLLQIRGEKTYHIFDPNDRSVLTEREIENFYGGDMNAAVYREENQHTAQVYYLTPGAGIHQPLNAPHWVKNSDAVSVSFSVSFETRAFKSRGHAHKVNHVLRRWGLTPTPVGESVLRDAVKSFAIRALMRAKPALRRFRRGH